MAYATIVKYSFFYTNWSIHCVLCSETHFSHALDLEALQCPCTSILIYLMFLMFIHYSMELFHYVYLTATLMTM